MSSEAVSYFPEGISGLAESQQRQTEAVEQPCLAEKDSEDALLQEAARGSKDALALLYRRVGPSIFRIAIRILRDHAEAEDLVHEVFLLLFRKANLFDPAKGSARTWIIQAAYTQAFNRRSFLTVRHHYLSAELHDDRIGLRRAGATEESSVNGILAGEILAQFQELLKPAQREVLELRLFAGLTFSEIADETGQTLVNVRHHYYRGRERLRAHFYPQKETTK